MGEKRPLSESELIAFRYALERWNDPSVPKSAGQIEASAVMTVEALLDEVERLRGVLPKIGSGEIDPTAAELEAVIQRVEERLAEAERCPAPFAAMNAIIALPKADLQKILRGAIWALEQARGITR